MSEARIQAFMSPKRLNRSKQTHFNGSKQTTRNGAIHILVHARTDTYCPFCISPDKTALAFINFLILLNNQFKKSKTSTYGTSLSIQLNYIVSSSLTIIKITLIYFVLVLVNLKDFISKVCSYSSRLKLILF